jgi:hypothetical protein
MRPTRSIMTPVMAVCQFRRSRKQQTIGYHPCRRRGRLAKEAAFITCHPNNIMLKSAS